MRIWSIVPTSFEVIRYTGKGSLLITSLSANYGKILSVRESNATNVGKLSMKEGTLVLPRSSRKGCLRYALRCYLHHHQCHHRCHHHHRNVTTDTAATVINTTKYKQRDGWVVNTTPSINNNGILCLPLHGHSSHVINGNGGHMIRNIRECLEYFKIHLLMPCSAMNN